MAHYRTTIASTMDASSSFSYMAAFENVATWDPGIASARRVGDAPLGVGTAFDVVAAFNGRQIPLTYEIREFEPGRRVVLVARTATMESVDEIVVTPTASGSDVTYDARFRFRGLSSLANPLLALAFRKIGDRARDGLRRELQR